jgi:hypothetical protein
MYVYINYDILALFFGSSENVRGKIAGILQSTMQNC